MFAAALCPLIDLFNLEFLEGPLKGCGYTYLEGHILDLSRLLCDGLYLIKSSLVHDLSSSMGPF